MRNQSEEKRVSKLRESVKAKAVESLAQSERVKADARKIRNSQ